MNITNDKELMVFKNEYGRYSIGLSKKKMDGSYENNYFPIRFKKDVVLENQTKIKINNAFLTFDNWEKDGKKGTTFYIMCLDFDKTDTPSTNEKKEVNDPFADFGDSIDDNYLD